MIHVLGFLILNLDSSWSEMEFFFLLYLFTGPGCSSVGFGEAEEIGPFHIKSDGKTLYLNQHSWNQGKTEMRDVHIMFAILDTKSPTFVAGHIMFAILDTKSPTFVAGGDPN